MEYFSPVYVPRFATVGRHLCFKPIFFLKLVPSIQVLDPTNSGTIGLTLKNFSIGCLHKSRNARSGRLSSPIFLGLSPHLKENSYKCTAVEVRTLEISEF